MNIKQLEEIHIHNQDVAWKESYDVALMRFLGEGNTLAEAGALADDLLYEINWMLANPEM